MSQLHKGKQFDSFKSPQCLPFSVSPKQSYTIVFPKIKVRESADSIDLSFLMEQS